MIINSTDEDLKNFLIQNHGSKASILMNFFENLSEKEKTYLTPRLLNQILTVYDEKDTASSLRVIQSMFPQEVEIYEKFKKSIEASSLKEKITQLRQETLNPSTDLTSQNKIK